MKNILNRIWEGICDGVGATLYMAGIMVAMAILGGIVALLFVR